MKKHVLCRLVLLSALLLCATTTRAEWRVRYTDEFRAMMQRAGRPVPQYVGN